MLIAFVIESVPLFYFAPRLDIVVLDLFPCVSLSSSSSSLSSKCWFKEEANLFFFKRTEFYIDTVRTLRPFLRHDSCGVGSPLARQ